MTAFSTQLFASTVKVIGYYINLFCATWDAYLLLHSHSWCGESLSRSGNNEQGSVLCGAPGMWLQVVPAGQGDTNLLPAVSSELMVRPAGHLFTVHSEREVLSCIGNTNLRSLALELRWLYDQHHPTHLPGIQSGPGVVTLGTKDHIYYSVVGMVVRHVVNRPHQNSKSVTPGSPLLSPWVTSEGPNCAWVTQWPACPCPCHYCDQLTMSLQYCFIWFMPSAPKPDKQTEQKDGVSLCFSKVYECWHAFFISLNLKSWAHSPPAYIVRHLHGVRWQLVVLSFKGNYGSDPEDSVHTV